MLLLTDGYISVKEHIKISIYKDLEIEIEKIKSLKQSLPH